MSTNFYLRLPSTPVAEDGLHIGLSTSHGRFLFEAHEQLGILSFADWERKFAEGAIEDAYKRPYTHVDFKAFVDAKQRDATHIQWWEEPGASVRPTDTRFVDAQGYSFDKREFC